MVASINPLVPGELIFFEAIFKLAYTLEPAIECQEYLSFVNFELHSIADSLDDNDILLENNLRLLRLYCGSKYIRESSRLKILRKIVREDSTTDGQGATLRDYQELLRIAKD